MDCNAIEGATEFNFVARRNNSLSSGGRLLVLGSLAIVVLAISLGFALNGAWLVLPFAGLDLLVVYLAFRCVGLHSRDYECVSVRGDQVVVERCELEKVRRFELSRHWAQVVFREARGMEHGRLALRSHGREVEFGLHLTDEQRAAVARRLKEHLKIC